MSYTEVEFERPLKRTDVHIPDPAKTSILTLIRQANELFHPYFSPPKKLNIKVQNEFESSRFKYDYVHGNHSMLLNEDHILEQTIILHEYGHSLFDVRMMKDLHLLSFVQNRIQRAEYFGREKFMHKPLSEQILKFDSIVLPYNEVFADLTAAIFLNDGTCHYQMVKKCESRITNLPAELKQRSGCSYSSSQGP